MAVVVFTIFILLVNKISYIFPFVSSLYLKEVLKATCSDSINTNVPCYVIPHIRSFFA